MNYIKFDIKNKDSLKKVVFLYILIQPFLSYGFFFTDSLIPKLTVAPATIFRIFGFIYIFINFFLGCKDKMKFIKFVSIYALIILIYSIFHIVGALNINFLPNNYVFSIIDELFYIFRMNIPIFLFIIIYNLKFEKKEVYKLIYYLSLIISLTIVLTNFLKISLVSYSEEVEFIKMSIFEWFSYSNSIYNFIEMTSKGFFLYANEIGNVLLMLLPFNLYFYYKYDDIKYLVGLLLILLSMLMIGTRTAFLGTYLSFFILFVYIIVKKIKNKKKFNYKRIIKLLYILYFHLILSLFSPIFLRYNWVELIYENISFSLLYIILFILFMFSFGYIIYKRKRFSSYAVYFVLILSLFFLFEDFITNRYRGRVDDGEKEKEIQKIEESVIYEKFYTEIYPKDYDAEFWNNLIKEPEESYNNTRKVQQKIFSRMMERSRNKAGIYYNLFGLSYSNFRNSGGYNLYLEKDILVHYYTIGLVGLLILISPYFLFIMFAIYLFLKDREKYFKIEKVIPVSSVSLVIFSSYFGGHVFDEMLPTIILSLLISFFFNKKIGGDKNEGKS